MLDVCGTQLIDAASVGAGACGVQMRGAGTGNMLEKYRLGRILLQVGIRGHQCFAEGDVSASQREPSAQEGRHHHGHRNDIDRVFVLVNQATENEGNR